MATLDKDRGAVVVRVVYDGPALAGKTTTVRALAASLGRPVFSGDEAEGRTLHFDWLDYVGGRFEGQAIRCQVVAVPGQTALASRRMRLLETADAVVFVGDSRAHAVDEGLRALEELRTFLSGRPAPAPAVVLQANKRDAADAVTMDELRDRLRVGPTVGVTQSIATDGTGVRETFVFAIRLALDLVRERMAQQSLATGAPEVDSGEQLLAALLAAEGSTRVVPGAARSVAPASAPSADASAPVAAAPVVARDGVETAPACAPSTPEPPRAPDASVASGLVWPPVEGRLVLHEAHALGVVPRRLKNGDWWSLAADTWRCHSGAEAEFANLDEGREALVKWARWHSGLMRWLSPNRCIALCQSGPARWRLWQIARRERSVGSAIAEAFAAGDADAAAAVLVRAVEFLAGAAADRLGALGLPVTATTVVAGENGDVRYVGLVPREAVRPAAGAPAARLRAMLGPTLRQAPRAPALDVPRLLERLKELAEGPASGEIVETLQAILIGH